MKELLARKKTEKELMQVTAARYDLEIRIEEMRMQITELERHIEVQLKREEELKNKLNEKVEVK